MEWALEESAQKRDAIDKKSFCDCRQEKSHVAIMALVNFVIFLEFITDDSNSAELLAIKSMFSKLGKL